MGTETVDAKALSRVPLISFQENHWIPWNHSNVHRHISDFQLVYLHRATLSERDPSFVTKTDVCFAEHPLSLSQAFPLIFQRLSRISEPSSSSSVV